MNLLPSIDLNSIAPVAGLAAIAVVIILALLLRAVLHSRLALLIAIVAGVVVAGPALGNVITNVINTLAEAVEILGRDDHPAIQTMFDFHNTLDEAEPFPVLIEKYFPHIHHVHVQEMDGRHLGAGDAEKDFVPSFQKLKDLRFDKWISVEVFDFSPGPETLAVESMKTLRAIEGKLG